MNQIESYLQFVYSDLIDHLDQRLTSLETQIDQIENQNPQTTTQLQRTLIEEKYFISFVKNLVENSQTNVSDWYDYVADVNTEFFDSRLRNFASEIRFSVEEEFERAYCYVRRIRRLYNNRRITRDLSISRRRFLSTLKEISAKLCNSESDIVDFLRDISRSKIQTTVEVEAQQVNLQ